MSKRTSFFLFCMEGVSVALSGDEAFVVRGYLFAKARYVDIDRAVGYVGLVRPHLASQLLAREYGVGVLQKQKEHFVFLLG